MINKTVCLWIDFMANDKMLFSEKEQHRIFLEAKESGIKEIVIDGKIPYGFTTYLSHSAPHVSSFSDGRYDSWKGRDLVRELIHRGREYGLLLWVKLDIFTEGHKDFKDKFWDEKKSWGVTFLQMEGGGSSHKGEQGNIKTMFVNPAHSEVQHYELGIVEEVAKQYNPDGIILDRARYPNKFADFSKESLQQFSNWVRLPREVEGREILYYDEGENWWREGNMYHEWVIYRSRVIKEFIVKVKERIQSASPLTKLALYTGAWYETSYEEGLNWASSNHMLDKIPHICKGDLYCSTSLADEVDRIFAGCYYPEIYRLRGTGGAMVEDTVEGSISRAKELINGACELYGGLYLLHYHNDEKKLEQAMEVIMSHSDGVMLFDHIYFKKSVWELVTKFVNNRV
ncbi:uncharacterized lipoprotein YddW (UPF0748 family) [Evansella vedderi]|uniref:Uncharacterized lipoprotein YddW (UPF0748 family) n=2 Tax=Evansella vedderi TaxID=38282 RepID=A0ABT9ZQK9_9BACI|nr:uncharacterized lipoprotein YddW (UPF0748 family) [Evansella vedderi]